MLVKAAVYTPTTGGSRIAPQREHSIWSICFVGSVIRLKKIKQKKVTVTALEDTFERFLQLDLLDLKMDA